MTCTDQEAMLVNTAKHLKHLFFYLTDNVIDVIILNEVKSTGNKHHRINILSQLIVYAMQAVIVNKVKPLKKETKREGKNDNNFQLQFKKAETLLLPMTAHKKSLKNMERDKAFSLL